MSIQWKAVEYGYSEAVLQREFILNAQGWLAAKTRAKGAEWEHNYFINQALDPPTKSIQIARTMINATSAQLRKAADLQEKIQSLQEELGQLEGVRPTEFMQSP
jgi:hypothetical protein